jgi:hypothetical protein
MNIHQLSVSYVQEQDRLLLRVNSRTGEELRLWLTRRLMLGLMPALRKAVVDLAARSPHYSSSSGEGSTTPVVLPDDGARQMLAEFQREAALKSADFQTPYQEQANALPLGAEPMLVTEVTLTIPSNGPVEMGFKQTLPGQAAQSLSLSLDGGLMHALVHMLEKGMTTALWLSETTATQAKPEQMAPQRPRYVN